MKASRNIIKCLFVMMFVLTICSGFVYASDSEGDVYVVPIKGDINKATYEYVKNNVKLALSENYSAIIFEIDTYGGYIEYAEKIKKEIVSINIPTISYVNDKAESAGVLLAISANKVAMAPGATIGSAEPIPNNPKILSLWVEMLKATAKLRNRNDELVAAMADKNIEIEGVVKRGYLLNLNYEDAKRLNLSDAIASDYSEILEKLDVKYNKIVVANYNFKNTIVSILSNPFIVMLLIVLGFIGLIAEIFTPGFGIGGTLAILCFGLYFWGGVVAGNSGYAAVIMFVVGIVLLLIELVIPGFGVPGVGGLISIVVSILLASESVMHGVIYLVSAFLTSGLFIFIMVKYGQKSPMFNKLVLTKSQDDSYTSSKADINLIGKEGIVVASLRPAGTIKIDESRIDAVSEGQFIKKGSIVEVTKIEGRRIVVKKKK
ncbi:NfeD family protein [Clostridiaceae bacterium M8S5]|nr:NfeD family protein [Clostridiaceae bacterium M8S5]